MRLVINTSIPHPYWKYLLLKKSLIITVNIRSVQNNSNAYNSNTRLGYYLLNYGKSNIDTET